MSMSQLVLRIEYWKNFWSAVFLGFIYNLFMIPMFKPNSLALLFNFGYLFAFSMMASCLVDALYYWRDVREKIKELKNGSK